MTGNLGAVAIVAASGGLVAGTLARSLLSYLTVRRSTFHLTLTTQDGRRVELDAAQVDDAEAVVQAILAARGAGDGEATGEADK